MKHGAGDERTRTRIALLFAAQAVAGAVWWLALAWVDGFAGDFSVPADVSPTIFRLALPDLVLFVGGSALAASMVWNRSPWAQASVGVVCGATWYATLWCVSVAAFHGASGLGALLMLPLACLDTWALACLQARRDREPSGPGGAR